MSELIGLDIGHGVDTYERTGGKGVRKNGKVYEEHTFNSAVAVELNKLLKHNGFRTLMYQKPMAKEKSLRSRANYYDRKKVDLVWSIHANAGNHKADGACSFYWYSNSGTQKLANYYAEEMRKAGYNTHGDGTHPSKPGRWTNLFMIREPRADAVLTENGFMTNAEEFKDIFLDPQYPKAMARIHAKAICRHFGVKFKDLPKKTSTDLYRVRKSWKNKKSQIGAFSVLENAVELAKKKDGYEVYDDDGTQIFPKIKYFRVRKAWGDSDSQVGAYTLLDNAKEQADDHAKKGYKVYDANGKMVYQPKGEQRFYRVRTSWEDAKSQVGAFTKLSHAKAKADKEAGCKVYNQDGKVVYEGEPEEPKPEEKPKDTDKKKAETVSKKEPKKDVHIGHTPIIGKAEETDVDKMVAFVTHIWDKIGKQGDKEKVKEIAQAFLRVGDKYGIRGDIAFAQSLIETHYFLYDLGTAVTPDQNNFCGMGVTSKGKKGNSFGTVRDGATAQIQHLFAYATKGNIPDDDKLLDPRFELVARGIAPHWKDLNMRWAMNDSYGEHILSIYQKIVDFNYQPETKQVEKEVAVEIDKPEEAKPEKKETKKPKEKESYKSLIDYFFQKLADFLKGGK